LGCKLIKKTIRLYIYIYIYTHEYIYIYIYIYIQNRLIINNINKTKFLVPRNYTNNDS